MLKLAIATLRFTVKMRTEICYRNTCTLETFGDIAKDAAGTCTSNQLQSLDNVYTFLPFPSLFTHHSCHEEGPRD